MKYYLYYVLIGFAGIGLGSVFREVTAWLGQRWDILQATKRNRERIKNYIPIYFNRIPTKEDSGKHLLVWFCQKSERNPAERFFIYYDVNQEGNGQWIEFEIKKDK